MIYAILAAILVAGGAIGYAAIQKNRAEKAIDRAVAAEHNLAVMKANVAGVADSIATDREAVVAGRKIDDMIKGAKTHEEIRGVRSALASRLDGLM